MVWPNRQEEMVLMVRCRDCKFCEEDWLTSLSGHGLYKFSYCQTLVHDCRVVEPDVERECEDFEEKPDKEKGDGHGAEKAQGL